MGVVRTFRGWFHFCNVCGTKMVHFRYPGRWRCPNEAAHPQILAEAARLEAWRKARRRAPRNRDSRGRFS